MLGKMLEMDKNQIGERIRLLREERHLSRDNLADQLEISYRYLCDLETGHKGMSVKLLCNLALTLGVTTDYILFGSSRYEDDDEQRAALKEGIDNKLELCPTPALQFMSDIVMSYVASHRERDEEK